MCAGRAAHDKMARMSYPVQHTPTNDLSGTLFVGNWIVRVRYFFIHDVMHVQDSYN